MTRTIDTPTFQAAVVRNCSPTLVGIKPASLFTYPGTYAHGDGSTATETMADPVAEGATSAGAETEVISCADFSADKAAGYDAIAFGCPAMGSEELEYDEFQPMWDEVKETLGDKKVVLFGSYSWAEGEWMDNWKADADEAGINVVDSVICYDAPDDEAEAACRALGAELA